MALESEWSNPKEFQDNTTLPEGDLNTYISQNLLYLYDTLSLPRIFGNFEYPAPGTDWTPHLEGAGLAAALATKKLWLTLDGLRVGEQIISYKIKGDCTEVLALTLDCKLVRINQANPITTTDIPGGAIVQIAADGEIDVEAVLTDPEVVAVDKAYKLEILGTTGVGDSITITHAEVVVDPPA
jgi:hypothetical protein